MIRKGATAAAVVVLAMLPWSCRGQSVPGASGAGMTAEGTCQALVIPAYFYPSAENPGWQEITAAAPAHSAGSIAILNPNSGPGTAVNPQFVEAVRAAQKAGVKVYGYVSTRYGAVDPAKVRQEILDYFSWYKVDGIFVDEVSAERDKVTYYQGVATFSTSKLPTAGVILNNGTYPDQAYAEIKVPPSARLQLVLFESDWKAFHAPAAVPPAWVGRYPASMFIDIVYATPADQLAATLRLTAARHAGAVYISELSLPNPYWKLPVYWNALTRLTQAGCSLAGRRQGR